MHAFDLPPSREVQERVARDLLSSEGICGCPEERVKACLDWLRGLGLVETKADGWTLSANGARATVSAWVLSSPEYLLRSERADVDVKDKSMYELLSMMHAQGWTLIGTAKVKQVADVATPYVHGHDMAKVYIVVCNPADKLKLSVLSRWYLVALLPYT